MKKLLLHSKDVLWGSSVLVITALLFFGCSTQPARVPDQGIVDASMDGVAERVQLPKGFKIEHLYSPSEHEQGSWVAMTTDDKGNLITSDQYGNLYRVALPAEDNQEVSVSKIPVDIGHAQGLLWAFNSLYVMVNSNNGVEGNNSGFYRVTDSDGDGELDQVKPLVSLKGSGEHGPHAVLLAPDGESIYVLAGNHTDLPETYTSVLPSNWNEDGIFPAIKDPRGHAASRMAPGGWVARTDENATTWEVFSSGYRNAFDMGFNADGELMVFDADMEWDMGMPWYRPIRICHATSGSEFGWRTGTGKWPAYYPDNLPPVVNIGQGSPTGVIMGTKAAFPAKYQKGLFAFDWSFGTMYFISYKVDGGSYSGEKEEFLSGVPLQLTDGVIGQDGAMYFATGGRKTESHLFKVTYVGEESNESIDASNNMTDAFTLRKELEKHHTNPGDNSLDLAWENLRHKDRFVRYAARVIIENQPVGNWISKLSSENDAQAVIEASISAARMGDESIRADIYQKLSEIDYQALSTSQKLGYIRAVGLTISRQGLPSADLQQTFVDKLSPTFPGKDTWVNKELVALLSALGDETIVAKTVPLMETTNGQEGVSLISEEIATRSEQYGPQIAEMLKNMPPAQSISYALSLSQTDKGWTEDLYKKYFLWFQEAMKKSGGVNYKGFLDHIRQNALSRVPEAEMKTLAEFTGSISAEQPVNFANLPVPEGPGKNYNASDIYYMLGQADEKERPFDFARGEKMYQAAMCSSCHMMNGKGSNIGPDLTQAGTRFSRRDIVTAIMLPSDVISDQYATTIFRLKDGSTRAGRIVNENDDTVTINSNPYDPNQNVSIARSDIESEELSNVSIMPPGLLNRLNDDEIVDLFGYIQAGGNASHEIYK